MSPTLDELSLEEPEIVKQGNRFGVRLKASAPSIHMIKAEIETEVNPIVGTEKQSEELVHYLLNEFEGDPKRDDLHCSCSEWCGRPAICRCQAAAESRLFPVSGDAAVVFR